VHAPNSFDYAVVRVVPFTEREEFFNAGVIVFCPQQQFLRARVHLDEAKLHVLAPGLAAEEVRQRLDAIVRIADGDANGGPIAQLAQRARFHWLVAPRSTLIQVSATHTGICDKPEFVLDRLFQEQVLEIPST
jgi:hypothetical protein